MDDRPDRGSLSRTVSRGGRLSRPQRPGHAVHTSAISLDRSETACARIHVCVTAYLLVRLLWWRARRDAGFAGGARNLLAQLARIRQCRIVEHSGRAGRPRVREQMEETDPALENLGRALGAVRPQI